METLKTFSAGVWGLEYLLTRYLENQGILFIPFFPGNIQQTPQLNQLLSLELPSVRQSEAFPKASSKKEPKMQGMPEIKCSHDDRILKRGVVIPLIFRNVP